MADVRLVKPAAGMSQTIVCEPGSRFVFDFPTDAATLSRSGDNMVMTFEDGSTILLENFYTAFNKDNMPTFEVEGTEIAGEDFFMAMNESDLMPAAGPGRAGAQSNGNRFHDYVTSDLLDGLDRLGGLDIGWPGGDVNPDTDGAATDYGDINYPVTITPGDSGDLDDDIPVIDNPDNPHDGNADPSAGRSVLNVNEAGLRGGSAVTASGHMLVDAPDGVASIVVGGIVVFDGSALTGQRVPTDEGYLEVTGFNATSGRLDYTYHLTQATQEHSGDGADKIAHDLAVTVTDRDGSTDTGVVTVVITDDVPEADNNEADVTENDAVSGNVLANDSFGADGGSGVTWDLSEYEYREAEAGTEGSEEGSEEGSRDGTYTVTDGVYTVYTQYGVARLNPDGSYTFTAKADAGLPPNDSASVEFGYTITDNDGDSADAKLTITINGDTSIPEPPDEAPSGIVVDEGALPGVGSGQHASHGYTNTGSFIVDLNGEDGTVTLKYGTGNDAPTITVSLINGEQFEKSWLSENKILTVNGVEVGGIDATQDLTTGKWTVNYTYKLTGAQDHTTAGVTGEGDRLNGTIDITVTDATGDGYTSSLAVEVHDDGPVLGSKVDFLPENNSGFHYDTEDTIVFRLAENGITTKLEDIEFGADVGNDNDTDPAVVTVTVNNEKFTITVTRDASGQLHFSGDEGSGKIVFTPDSEKPNAGGSLSYDTATGAFIYTRPSGDIGGSANDYAFTVTVTDADGDTVQQSGKVTTVFRQPTIGDNGNTSSTVITDEGNLVEGSGTETEVTEGYDNKTQGSLTVNLDHAEGTIQIGNLTIGVDKDGNVVSVKNGDEPGENLGGEIVQGTHGYLSGITVSEAEENGSITITYNYTLTYAVDGDAEGTSGNVPAIGMGGRGEAVQADEFGVTVTAGNQTASGSIIANALDDVPTITGSSIVDHSNDSASTITGQLYFDLGADATGSTLTVEVGGTTFIGTQVQNGWSFTAENPKVGEQLTMDASGNFTYTRPTADLGGNIDSYTFTVTVTDADGDTVTHISSPVTTTFESPTIGDNGNTSSTVITDEGNLVEGSGKETTATEAYGSQAQGSLTVNLDHAEGTIQIGNLTIGVDKDGNVVSVKNGDEPGENLGGEIVQGTHGYLSEITVSEAEENGSITITYNYTLTDAVDGEGTSGNIPGEGWTGRGEAVQADEFGVTVTAGNQTASGSIIANALDDVPVMTSVSITSENLPDTVKTISGKVEGLNFGADVDGSIVTVKVNTDTYYTGQVSVDESGTISIDFGDDAPISMQADGTFTYTRPESDVQNKTSDSYTFYVKVTDSDGDYTEEQSVTVTTVAKPGFEGQTSEDSVVDSLVTDDSGLDGGNASDPDGAEGKANTATDTGYFSVTLNGHEYTITLTGKDENDAITLSLTADGNLQEPGSLENVTLEGKYGTLSNIEVANGTISYTYTQTDNYLHELGDNDCDAAATGADSFTVSVSDGQDTARGTIEVTIEDDGPDINASVGTTVGAPESDNLVSNGDGFDFVVTEDGKTHYYGNAGAGSDVGSKILQGVWGNKVTITAGRVQYDGSGDSIYIKNFIDKADGVIKYSEYIKEHPNKYEDWGIFVDSTIDGNTEGGGGQYETNANDQYSGTDLTSEAIVIDLGGQLAYGVTVDFGAFYYTFKNEGKEEGQEFALISFYKDENLITQRIVESDATTNGTATVTVSNEFLSGGFDKVVISSLWNDWDSGNPGQASTFTIQGLDFITAPKPLYVTEGTVSAVPGADGWYHVVPDSPGESGVQADGDFTLANVRFDVPETLTVHLDDSDQTATLTIKTDDSGNSRLTATTSDGKQIFSAALDKQADGSYTWKMEQYEEFTVVDKNGSNTNSFQLGFVTMDGDGDVSIFSVKVPLNPTVVDSSDTDESITITSDTDTAGLIVTGEDASVISVTAGESEKIASAGELNAALAGGLTLVPAFEELAGNTIDSSASESAVNLIYGDVMNTDALVTDTDGSEIGMGYDNLEKTGWSSEPSTTYIQDNVENLGRETLSVDSGNGEYDTYYRDGHGDAYKPGDNDPLTADDLEKLSFIGREGGDDAITGTAHNDFIFGQEGNDTIHGGEGSDTLYGGSGDDYLDGGAGTDTVYGGDGNDIIVYDGNDYLIDGGSGIDIMVGGANTPSLDTLLEGGANKTIVHDVEVLITGDKALDLTSMGDLGQYGITIGKNDSGQETLTLTGAWTADTEAVNTYHYSNDGVDLTLQTTIEPPHNDDTEAAVQQQVLILQTSNS